MNPPADNRSISLSQWLYQRLLAAYPRTHREEYGGAMVQLFRDQCRDAWNEARNWGLAVLWLRILPDLVKTSFMERFTSMNPGKFMSNTVSTLLNLRRGPKLAFLATFTVVFLFVFGFSVLITWLLPEEYGSTVRIKVEPEGAETMLDGSRPNAAGTAYDPYFVQTTFEIIQSQMVLSNVVSQLNLNKVWGRKYYAGETLKTTETMDILKQRMDLRPIRNTKLIAITVYSEDRNEAAQVANAVAEAYQDYRLDMWRQFTMGAIKEIEQQYADSDAQIQAAVTNADFLRASLDIRDTDANALDPQPTLSDQQLQSYNQQMIEGERVYDQINKQLNDLIAADQDHVRDMLPSVTADNMLGDLLGKLHQCKQEYVVLTNAYAADSPKVVRVQSLINELNSEIDARVAGILAGLRSEVDAKKTALDSLRKSVDDARMADQKRALREQPYWEAKRKLKRLLDFNKFLAAEIEGEKLALELPKNSLVAITDTAEPGNAPVKPNKPLNVLIGLIAGVLCGSVAGLIAAILSAQWARRRSGLAMSTTA